MESKCKKWHTFSMCAISMHPMLVSLFVFFTFGFVQQLQTTENTIWLDIENILLIFFTGI
jgi:hypothetical protein